MPVNVLTLKFENIIRMCELKPLPHCSERLIEFCYSSVKTPNHAGHCLINDLIYIITETELYTQYIIYGAGQEC